MKSKITILTNNHLIRQFAILNSMATRKFINIIITYSLVIIVSIFIHGCGGGGGSKGDIAADKSVTLNWILPDTREDGGYLQISSLQGVRFYSGITENDLELILDLEESGIESYTLTGLKAGAYYFGISVYDKYGLESEISNLVLKEAQ
jgi:hypothetical protein